MQLQGERSINAKRSEVWLALNNPDVLKTCIPGCDELTKDSDNSFEATVTQKVGPVKARFKGSVELTDIVENTSYTISGEGKGGAAGFAKGSAKVYLKDEADGGTLLTYDVDAKVGGKLAQLGSRLIVGFARKMADDFFARFQNAVEPPEEDQEGAEDAAGEDSEDAPEQPKKGWFRRLIS